MFEHLKVNEAAAAAHSALAEKLADVMRLIPAAEFEDGTRRFYTCDEDAERLRHTEPYEAVQEFIDEFPLEDPLPAEVTVYEFAPMEITNMAVHRAVDDILERLDEDYGDPDGEVIFEATPLMRAVEALLHEVFQRQYRPWMCRQVGSFQMATEGE